MSKYYHTAIILGLRETYLYYSSISDSITIHHTVIHPFPGRWVKVATSFTSERLALSRFSRTTLAEAAVGVVNETSSTYNLVHDPQPGNLATVSVC